ncbi:S24 family peptidase [Chryseobacterium wangxinyae]|uniref:S24 family peptidase n=1 Tax=Chryseobacterium sp. CY353 TaxID=2997334 RepID=UPI00226ECFFF|nr:S24 family peptidase [Chryseobacterium sp. CY353]MCY0967894.1 S24 family peptidase [Chryseobacterium sp. CY353]
MKENNTLTQIELKDRINMIMGYLKQIDPISFKNQTTTSKKLNIDRSNLSALLNGDPRYLKIDSPIINKIFEQFRQLNKEWLKTGKGEMYIPAHGSSTRTMNIRTSTLDDIDLDIDSLNKKVRDLTRKSRKVTGEGTIINEDDLVEATEYVVPIKGQAGLQKAFFYPDEYIEQNFKHDVILVKPSERGTFLKIEVDGGSMPGVLDPGDWARCEEIPKIHWLDKNVFKPKKVYCLFHNKRGILFKRISKVSNDTITLSSDNKDKIEYPDEEFNLIEFSKILIVKKVEKNLDL